MQRHFRLKSLFVLVLMLASALTISAEEKSLQYFDAQGFTIIGRGHNDSSSPYFRLPAHYEDSVRTGLWFNAVHTAGMGVRFRTNSTTIGARYTLYRDFAMAHMAYTGIKGTDLYRRDERTGVWHHVNTARPIKDSIQHKTYVENMDGEWHEYMIYFPLYDGIKWLEIGIDSTAQITKPQIDSPRRKKKIVFYGTSIMQGGCASRTGMVATNIIERDLDVECINLGFSGEGKQDSVMARFINQIEDVICYVIDPVPNCTKNMCDSLTYGFVNMIRQAHPGVPVIMVEGIMYPYTKYDSYFQKYLPEKNAMFRKNFELLKKDNPHDIYYVDYVGQIGLDEEGTVDGVHLTDYGFRAYADKLLPVLRKVLKNELKCDKAVRQKAKCKKK